MTSEKCSRCKFPKFSTRSPQNLFFCISCFIIGRPLTHPRFIFQSLLSSFLSQSIQFLDCSDLCLSPFIISEFVCGKPYGLLHHPKAGLPNICLSLLLSIFVPAIKVIFLKVFDDVIFQLKNIFKFHIIYQIQPNSLTWPVRPITQPVYPPYKFQPPRTAGSFLKVSCSFWPSPYATESLLFLSLSKL